MFKKIPDAIILIIIKCQISMRDYNPTILCPIYERIYDHYIATKTNWLD